MISKSRPLQRLAEAALLGVLLAGRALAQDPDLEYRRPQIEQRKASQQVEAAKESAKLQAPDDDVTFEQVLADPDNAELNYRYARAQVRRGDLKGAAATLERMLLVNPNQPRIRLFYAVVLYRLDNIVEAERELDILAKLNLGGELGQEVETYRKAVAKRTKKNHLTGRAGIGFQYDTNRNAAPSDGSRLFSDIVIPLSPSSQRRDDTAAIFLAGLDYKRDLGRGVQGLVTANYYRAEQTLVDTLDLQAYSVGAGAAVVRGRNSFAPSFVFDHVLLSQQTYLRSRGVDLRYDRKLGKRGDVYVNFRDVYQDFVKNDVVPTADERDGIQVDLVVGGNYVLNPKMRVGGGLQRTWKHASREFNAFDRTGVLANHTWLLGRGTFMLTNFVMYYDRYKVADTAISRKLRRDTTFRPSLTLGAPLSLAHKSLKDLVLTATYEYYQALSSVQNFAYTNNKIGTMLTYKFDLGF